MQLKIVVEADEVLILVDFKQNIETLFKSRPILYLN